MGDNTSLMSKVSHDQKIKEGRHKRNRNSVRCRWHRASEGMGRGGGTAHSTFSIVETTWAPRPTGLGRGISLWYNLQVQYRVQGKYGHSVAVKPWKLNNENCFPNQSAADKRNFSTTVKLSPSVRYVLQGIRGQQKHRRVT